MNKRKLSAFAAAVLAAALSLTACGDSAQTEDTTTAAVGETETEASETEQTAAAAPADIVNKILDKVEMSSMAEITSDRIGNYVEIDMSQVTDFSMYICGSGAFADEVGVFLMDSPEAASEAVDVINKRIETRTADFKDYNPDEGTKLESSVVKTKDCWLFYVISGDNEGAEAIFDENT